jgi:hypothetical protein
MIGCLPQKNDDLRGRMKCSSGAESCGYPADKGISARKKEIDESLKYVRDAAKEKKKLLVETEEKEFPMAPRAVRAVIKWS